jgi:hypothetical protein
MRQERKNEERVEWNRDNHEWAIPSEGDGVLAVEVF